MKNLLLLAIIFLFGHTVILAQQKKLSGVIIEEKTQTHLSGVTIQSKQQTVESDSDGKFSINVSKGDVLIFTHVGMKSYTLRVPDSDLIAPIQMQEDPQLLNDVVMLGYTTEKKKDIKGAVTVVKVGDVLKETNANLFTSLQGRVPGLDISTDGAPGSGVFLNIRGLASLNNNTPPLLIVDGVPSYDFNGLSPNDVESIQVLRDAASSAIYGARASSGVIIITTKKGKSKTPKVSFDAYYGQKTRRGHVDMLDALQYGQVYWNAYANDNNGAIPNDPTYGNGPQPVIPAFIDPVTKTTPSANTDWQKEVFRPATNMSYNLGVSQAAEKSNFYFGVNYNREDGLAKYTYYDRFTARINTSFALNKRINIGENLSLGYLSGNRENESRALEAAVVELPIIPLKDNLGNWAGPFNNLGDFNNPLGTLWRYRGNKTIGWRTFGNVFADIEIIKGLTYHGSFAIDLLSSEFKQFNPTWVQGRFSNTVAALNQTDNHGLNLTSSHTLTYNWSKGKHDVQLLAGYEWIKNEAHSLTASRESFFSQSADFTFLDAGATITGNGGNGNEYGLIGQFGKINYAYNNKYLLSASIRRDGSSRFGPLKRYGVFTALSGAWHISEEKFFMESKLTAIISDLKLRASLGQNGNDNIKNYNYASFYAPSIDYANYDILGTNTISQTGYILSSIGNPSTQWEASKQTNIGFDLGLFKNKIYLSADYYIKNSNRLLYQPQLAAVSGEGTPPFINVGNIRNTGIELMLNYKSQNFGKFKYSLDLVFSSNKNKVLSVGKDGNDVVYTNHGIIQKGQPLGEFFGWDYEGIIKTKAENDSYKDLVGQGGVGGMRFKNVNGDSVIDAKDRTYLGNPMPKFQFGLNINLSYGDFDATLFFDSKVGNKIYDEWLNEFDFFTYPSNHSKDLLNAWSPSNSNSTIPALTLIDHQQKRNSSYFISDASFFRLKSLTIGYNVSKSVLSRVKISNLRFYFQAENLFTLTKFKGYDYETLITGVGNLGTLTTGQYPHTKGWTFGINVGL